MDHNYTSLMMAKNHYAQTHTVGVSATYRERPGKRIYISHRILKIWCKNTIMTFVPSRPSSVEKREHLIMSQQITSLEISVNRYIQFECILARYHSHPLFPRKSLTSCDTKVFIQISAGVRGILWL